MTPQQSVACRLCPGLKNEARASAGALIPGLLLVFLYMLYILGVAYFKPDTMPAHHREPDEDISLGKVIAALLPMVVASTPSALIAALRLMVSASTAC